MKRGARAFVAAFAAVMAIVVMVAAVIVLGGLFDDAGSDRAEPPHATQTSVPMTTATTAPETYVEWRARVAAEEAAEAARVEAERVAAEEAAAAQEAARQAAQRRATAIPSPSSASGPVTGDGGCGKPGTIAAQNPSAIPDRNTQQESGFTLDAYNCSSSASGKYQFLDSTWQATCAAMGLSCPARAKDATESLQDAVAAGLWDGGRGCSHWSAC